MARYVDYTKLDVTEEEKKEIAIRDIIDFVGEEVFNNVTTEAREKMTKTHDNFLSFMRQCSLFLGVSGYPLEAWWEYIFPENVVDLRGLLQERRS